MLAEQRKEELDRLLQRAACAGDAYYFDMDQDEFDEEMEDSEEEEYYAAYCRQREIGFDAYRAEVVKELAALTGAEELHYLMDGYNYDDGSLAVEQVVLHPDCDIKTARMVYWLLVPDYYYRHYGGPANCPPEDVNREAAALLVKLEERAQKGGFLSGLEWDGCIPDEQPDGLDFSTEPFCRVPEIFRR